MKRPIIYLCLNMILGIILAVYYNWLFVIFLLVLTIIWICYRGHLFNFRYFTVLLIFLLIGYINTTCIDLKLKQIDSKIMYDEPVTLIGQVEDIDIQKGNKLIIKVKTIEQKGLKISPKISVIAFIKGNNQIFIGDEVNLNGYLKAMKRPANPGGFDELNYYYSRKIYYKLYTDKVIIIKNNFNFKSLISSLQTSIKAHIYNLFPDNEASIISTMLLGMKEELSQTTKKLYQISGISHLLAISGLHVSIIGIGFFNLLKKIIKTVKLSVGISIIVLLIYCILSGGSISTVRATIMLSLMLLSCFLGEKYDVFTAIFLSAFIILLLNPYQLFDVGFLLSFSAVLGIVCLTPIFEEKFNLHKRNFFSLLFVTISASLCTYPIITYFFYQLSLYGIIVNLIIVPVMSLVIGLSIMSIFLSYIWIKLGTIVAGIVYFILKYIEMITVMAASLPLHIIHIKKPSIVCIIVYYLILALVAIRGIKHRSYIIVYLLIIVFLLNSFVDFKNDSNVEVTFLDVGQGDSSVIRYQNKVWLVDGGGNINSTSLHNQGYYVLLPFLYSQGISQIEGIWISHSDFDHIYGIIEVVEEVPTKYIIMSIPYSTYKDELTEKLLEIANKKNINIYYFSKGDNITYNELSMTCLYPGETTNYFLNNNARSLAVKLKFYNFEILFPGDIESDQEYSLISLNSENEVSADILKVPHHGSDTSSSDIFIDGVCPKVAIFSYGEHNKFGHPSSDVVNNYKNRGIDGYHIKDEGAITITSDGKSFSVFSFSTNRKVAYECSN